MKKVIFLLSAAVLMLAACTPDTGSDPRVDKLMRKMTLDEKIGQLVLFTGDWSVTFTRQTTPASCRKSP